MTITNCIFAHGHGGVIENIVVNNVIMDRVVARIMANGYYFYGADKNDKVLFSKEPAEVTEEISILWVQRAIIPIIVLTMMTNQNALLMVNAFKSDTMQVFFHCWLRNC